MGTVYGAVASFAIDDDTDGTWGKITRTDEQIDPWWKLNLREVTSISEIIIFNRSDCCSERILGFELIVRYEGVIVYSSETEDPDESSTNKPIYRFDLNGVDQADEVEIVINGIDRILSLAEVQVFGKEQKALLSTPPSLFPSSTTMPSVSPSILPSSIPSIFPIELPSAAPLLLPVNIALLGEASQSSTAHGAVASRAIDDNTDGIWQNDSVTHTSGNDAETWWKLNLRTVSSISEVVIYNRSDCCSNRILNFVLIVRYEGQDVYSSEIEDPDESSTDKEMYSFSLSEVKMADEVEIALPGANRILSLAEVQVYGSEDVIPSSFPTELPSAVPSILPSSIPSSFPTELPSASPSILPSSISTSIPTFMPSASFSSSAPTATPSTFEECVDSPLLFKFQKPSGGKTSFKTCENYVASNSEKKCIGPNKISCPKTCASCDNCVDSKLKFMINVDGENMKKTCANWVANKPAERCEYEGVRETCRKTCQLCS